MATLKPATLTKATSVSALQTQMKADLKSRGGQTDVKFIAAKNCKLGPKTMQLFIVTDNPALFEPVIKAKFPDALRSKGTCDVLQQPKEAFQVVIKTCTGSLTPAAAADAVRLATASEKKITATYGRTARPVTEPVKSGVSDVDRDDYLRDAPKVVMASLNNGIIGSIYFEGDGRIRTTHPTGPKRNEQGDRTTVQFNIDRQDANTAFTLAKPKKAATKDAKKRKEYYQEWLKTELGQATPTNLPPWAQLVTGPDTGFTVGSGPSTAGMQLIEIFKDINGQAEGWHPSRGVAAKFVTDKQTISVLKAGIKYLDDEGLKDPNIRNIAFYEFVQARLPKFIPYMRDPKDITTKLDSEKKKKKK